MLAARPLVKWVYYRVHDLLNHPGVGNTEAARHGTVRNGADMLFGPLPDGLTVRRSPCFLPDVEKLLVDGHIR